MGKITLEKIENDYREAIRDKFKIEQIEGKHSHYLNNPSQALLRDLCWEIFSSDPKPEDLNVYRNFFRTDFKSEEDTSTKYTDKFKKVGGFYRGEKKPANISTVDLAAILVDFHPRPFNKFRKEMDPEDIELIKDLRDTNFTKDKVATDILKDEVKTEEFKGSETTTEIEEPEQIEIEEQEPTPTDEQKNTSMGIMTLINTGTKPPFNIVRFFAIGVVLIGLGFIIYLALPDTECMQWSNDHYEIVDCDQETQGLVRINQVELLDKSLINLKKVKVCDTTPCFDKNGAAIIWYAKTANGIDFFNGHGRHPENNRALRPITPYIFNKYVKK